MLELLELHEQMQVAKTWPGKERRNLPQTVSNQLCFCVCECLATFCHPRIFPVPSPPVLHVGEPGGERCPKIVDYLDVDRDSSP